MATVCGTDDYEVLINLDGDREKSNIKSMFCSCPYADSGANCKHMAAVLFEWENGDYKNSEVGSIEMDDSDGATEIFADACMEIWEEILENAEYNLKRTMFQWFMKCLEGAVADYMEDCVEQIFIEDFKEKEFLKEKLKYSDDRVQKAKRGAKDSWSAGYYGGKWALHHIELMKERKSPMEEILRRMKKIEGGEKKVKEIVEFREREYRGRTAMMEELKKL